MLNHKPFLFAVLYSALVIAFKLVIILGGYAVTDFGFKWAHTLTVLPIVFFIWLTIRGVRAQNGGYIGGRKALKSGLQMTIISIAIISVYNYIEFEWQWKALCKVYYNGPSYHRFLENSKGIKPEQYQEIINAQIAGFSALSPFKYATFKMFLYLLFGISSSFSFAAFMKRNPPYSLN